MTRILTALLLAALSFAASADVHLARYGVQYTAPFKLYNADGTLDVDESDGGTEVSVRCQGGTNTTATNDFADKGSDYEVVLTASEMQCATVIVTVAATTTEVFFINTVNNASAAIPTLEANVASASTGAIENQDFATTPGAAGGLLIAGTNADFDVTANSSFAGGVSITQSSSNAAALVVTGNGTGNGATFTSGSGATGNGISAVAASTNGNGLAATGTGTGSGLIGTGGATGDGLEGVGGSTSGAGLRAAGTAGNSPAATLVGQGSAAGLLATGGATGAGISAVGGSTSGVGLLATGSAGNSAAMSLVGQGSASGLLATGGATGHGMRLVGGSTSGNGISTAITAPSAGAPELGFDDVGTLSGTHSSTTADLGANAPGTVSDVVGHTLRFPTRKLSRTVTAYDTATGIATFAAIDADITLTNADPWLLFGTAPGSGGSAPTASEVAAAIAALDVSDNDNTADSWGERLSRIPNAAPAANGGLPTVNASNYVAGVQVFDEDLMTIDINATPTGAAASVTGPVGSVSAGGITAPSFGTGAIDAAALNADAGTEIGTATWASTTRLLTAGTNIVLAKGTGVTGFNDLSAAQVESEANDALVAIHLHHLLAADYDPASKPGVATALFNELIESDAGVSQFTANALEEAPTGSGASVDAIADEVETRTIAGVTLVNGLAANSITAAATAADFSTEVQSGLATASALASLTTTVGAAGAGLTAVDDAVLAAIEQTARADAAIINCTTNTANFAGSTTTVACILTDRDAGAITAASGDLEGRELLILSGAQIYEGRFINDTAWDAANGELQLTLSRALPGALADAVTAIIR